MARSSFLCTLFLMPVLALGVVGCGEQQAARGPTGTAPADEGNGGAASTPYAASDLVGGMAKGRLDDALLERAGDALARARAWILEQQMPSGAWGIVEDEPNVGVTGMAAMAVVSATPSVAVAQDEAIRKALDYLVSQQKEDGSVFDNPRYVNYMTSAATGALGLAKIGRYASSQREAMKFLADSQISESPSDPSYGGFPYKQDQGQVSDLSNGQFAVTALADAGLPADSEVWDRVVTYLDRVQNRSENGDFKAPVEHEGEPVTVVSGDDGGAGYSPVASKAGLVKRSDGTYEPRSYGSMTYALLKCYLLAGVDADDPRVQAALQWLSENFTVDRNPGFEQADDAESAGQQGYYYYLHTMARALAEYERETGEPLVVKDAQGKEHSWRPALIEALLQRQRDDGTWTNENDRWMEGAPILATSYAVGAMAEAMGRFR